MRGARHWVGVVLVIAVVAAGCGGDSSGADDEEQARFRPGPVRRFLDQDLNEGAQTPVEVTGVRCPPAVAEGRTDRATCKVTINGVPVELDVERTGRRFSRTQAVVEVLRLETFVMTQYDARLGLAVIVDCGPEELLPVAPGDTIDCGATDGEGAKLTAGVTVEDLAGKVTVTLM